MNWKLTKIAILTLLTVCTVSAGPVDETGRVPFAPGATLTDTALNADFNRLREAINLNATDIAGLSGVVIYKFQDYIEDAAIVSKTFKGNEVLTGTDPCTTVTWSFVRSPSGSDTIVERSQLGCGFTVKNYFRSTSSEYIWTQQDVTNALNSSAWAFDTGITVLDSSMSIGDSWAGATMASYTSAGVTSTAFYMQKSTLLSSESVSFAAVNGSPVTYDNCLKFYTTREKFEGNGSLNVQNFKRLSWLCPGLGEVKRSESENGLVSTGANARIVELTGKN